MLRAPSAEDDGHSCDPCCGFLRRIVLDASPYLTSTTEGQTRSMKFFRHRLCDAEAYPRCQGSVKLKERTHLCNPPGRHLMHIETAVVVCYQQG